MTHSKSHFTIYHFCKWHETIMPIFVFLNCSLEITRQGLSTLQKSHNSPCLIATHRYTSSGLLNGIYYILNFHSSVHSIHWERILQRCISPFLLPYSWLLQTSPSWDIFVMHAKYHVLCLEYVTRLLLDFSKVKSCLFWFILHNFHPDVLKVHCVQGILL